MRTSLQSARLPSWVFRPIRRRFSASAPAATVAHPTQPPCAFAQRITSVAHHDGPQLLNARLGHRAIVRASPRPPGDHTRTGAPCPSTHVLVTHYSHLDSTSLTAAQHRGSEPDLRIQGGTVVIRGKARATLRGLVHETPRGAVDTATERHGGSPGRGARAGRWRLPQLRCIGRSRHSKSEGRAGPRPPIGGGRIPVPVLYGSCAGVALGRSARPDGGRWDRSAILVTRTTIPVHEPLHMNHPSALDPSPVQQRCWALIA